MSDMTIHLLQALTDGMFWLDRRTCARLGGGKDGICGEGTMLFGWAVAWGWVDYIPVVATETVCRLAGSREIIFGIERSQGERSSCQGGSKKCESTGVNAAIETGIRGVTRIRRGGRAVPERKVRERT
jgi:hypothetical protein